MTPKRAPRNGRRDPKNAAAAAAELMWLEGFLFEGRWFDRLCEVTTSLVRPGDGSDVALDPVAERLLHALDLAAPSLGARVAKQAGPVLVDPSALADRLRGHRQRCALALAEKLGDTERLLEGAVAEAKQRAALERALRVESFGLGASE